MRICQEAYSYKREEYGGVFSYSDALFEVKVDAYISQHAVLQIA